MERETESADDLVEGDENLTQKAMGEGEPRPVDVSWGGTEDLPREGEEGTDPVV